MSDTNTGQEPTDTTPLGSDPAGTDERRPPWERTGEPFDPARAWSLIERLRGDLATARTSGRPAPTLTPTATTPTTAPAAPSAPVQPTAPSGQPGDVGDQVAALRAELTRERLARRYGLDDDLVDLLGTGSDEQIEARAKTLADRLSKPGASGSPVPRRPIEQLRGGADPTSDPEETDPEKLAAKIRRRF
ncbi:MAG TPA: hypothetical protein VF755_00980 [Catenuloplanes sp.]|jgi:hypothetical protein